MLAGTTHGASSSGTDAGIFSLRPGDSSAKWQPLAPGGRVNWQIVATATGVRVWSLVEDPTSQLSGTLEYFDLP
jgi:hypothetical protein